MSGKRIVREAVDLLLKKGITIATAESCTGGLVAKMITDFSGVSEIFSEGYVTYANSAKMKNLGVKEETLSSHGAVSAEVAREMAEGVRARSGANFGVSATGIAGPGGGIPEKPVGTVFIALATENKTIVEKLSLSGSRSRVRRKTAYHIFDLIRREIK